MTQSQKKLIVPVPHLGQGIEEAEVALWHIKEGESILIGYDLCEIVTNKVSFNVPAPQTGMLFKKCLIESDIATVGKPLAILLIS